MYRLFYNHAALKDLLIIVINPEAHAAFVETKGDIAAIYGDDHKLIGVNIFHIDEVMKIKANGVIFVPDERLIQVINHMLIKEGMEPLPPVMDSGYRVAKVTKTEEHPLDEKALIVKLECGDKEYETVTSLKGIKEGSIVVIALDGTILYDGSQYHAEIIRHINNDVKIVSAPELHIEGEEDVAFLLNDDPSFTPGEDFFLR